MPVSNPIDTIVARLRQLAANTSGFGAVSEHTGEVEFTVSRIRKGGALEDFETFVRRVDSYRQVGDVVVWQMADGEYTLARISRRA